MRFAESVVHQVVSCEIVFLSHTHFCLGFIMHGGSCWMLPTPEPTSFPTASELLYSSFMEVSTVVGGTFGLQDGIGTDVQFLTPAALTILDKYLFVVDSIGLHRVDLITQTSTLILSKHTFGCQLYCNV